MEKAVNSKQMTALIFMSVMALKIFMVPGLFLIYAGRNGWIPMLIFVLIELSEILLVLIAIKLNPGKTFLQVMQSVFGKIVTRIILAVIIVILFIKLVLMLGEVRMFFSTSTLGSVDFGVSLAALLVVFVLFSLKGLRVVRSNGTVVLSLRCRCAHTAFYADDKKFGYKRTDAVRDRRYRRVFAPFSVVVRRRCSAACIYRRGKIRKKIYSKKHALCRSFFGCGNVFCYSHVCHLRRLSFYNRIWT